MKKTFTYIIITSFCLSFFYCKKEKAEFENSIKSDKIIYKRFNIDHVDSFDKMISTSEIYVDNNDTIYNQFKKYDSIGNIDLSKSEYFDFILRKDTLTNIFFGKVTYHNILDYKLKSPIKEKNLKLFFYQQLKDSIDIIEFESKDQNYVEFKFYNRNDTIKGMLFEYRVLDTLINGEKMARIIETYHAIDNLPFTDNPFIKAFDINYEVVYE